MSSQRMAAPRLPVDPAFHARKGSQEYQRFEKRNKQWLKRVKRQLAVLRTTPIEWQPKGGRSLSKLLKPGVALKEFERIKRRLNEADAEYDQVLRSELAGLLDIAAVQETDANAWLEFCRHPYWAERPPQARPKPDQPADALRFLVHLLCAEVKDREIRNRRIHLYYSALRELRARSAKTSNDAEEVLNKKGIATMSKAWAQREKARIDRETGSSTSQPEARPDKLKPHAEEQPRIELVEIIMDDGFQRIRDLEPSRSLKIRVRKVEIDKSRLRLQFCEPKRSEANRRP